MRSSAPRLSWLAAVTLHCRLQVALHWQQQHDDNEVSSQADPVLHLVGIGQMKW